MMIQLKIFRHAGIAVMLAILTGAALARLPPPTPAQAEAAAAKKAQAVAQADQDKQALLASMDAVAAHWRAKAAANGWQANPATPVAAPIAAISAPTTQSSASGQPGGQLGSATQAAPMRSEKSGTAAPAQAVQQAPANVPGR